MLVLTQRTGRKCLCERKCCERKREKEQNEIVVHYSGFFPPPHPLPSTRCFATLRQLANALPTVQRWNELRSKRNGRKLRYDLRSGTWESHELWRPSKILCLRYSSGEFWILLQSMGCCVGVLIITVLWNFYSENWGEKIFKITYSLQYRYSIIKNQIGCEKYPYLITSNLKNLWNALKNPWNVKFKSVDPS